MIRLERPLLAHPDILRLVLAQLGQLHADLGEMQPRHLLVQRLRQHVDLLFVLAVPVVGEEFDLRQRLVGERGRHHETRMAHGVAEVHQAALRQQDHALAVGEFDLIDLRLDVVPFQMWPNISVFKSSITNAILIN
jgi:hypothetical protein